MKLVAYTDGSFSVARVPETGDEIGVYGAGVYCILENNIDPITIRVAGTDVNLARMRNVAGELLACFRLIDFVENTVPQYNEIDIYYDYEGVEKWVTGEWRANKSETMAYRNYMREAQKKRKITFVKVPAHSVVFYNEQADALAKQAVEEECRNRGLEV